ncbi:MAG: MFS transporter [Thermodesulfobacteriota bacterium]
MDRRLYLALFLTILSTTMGTSIVLPLLPVYAVQMGATGFELGLIFTSFALARAITLPLAGRMAESYGRRGFLLWGLILFAVTSGAYDLARNVREIIAIRVLQGVAAAMVVPMARAYVGEMSPPGQEGRLMGHFNVAFFGGLTLGPFLGGYLKDTIGISSAFYSMGILTLIGFVLSWTSVQATPIAVGREIEKQASYLALLRHPGMTAIFLFRFGTIIGTGMQWSFLPVYGHQLGLSSSRIGVLISITVLMTTMFQPFFGWIADRVNRPLMTIAGGLSASLLLMILPFCHTFGPLLVVNLIMGTSFGLYVPPLMAMTVEVGRETGHMTKAMSLLEMSFSFGMVAGPLLAGLVEERWGVASVFWIGGVSGLLVTLLFLVYVLIRGRDLGQTPPPRGADATF